MRYIFLDLLNEITHGQKLREYHVSMEIIIRMGRDRGMESRLPTCTTAKGSQTWSCYHLHDG